MRIAGWQVLVAQGVVATLVGLLAMVWPLATALAFVVLFGVFALLDGLFSLVSAFRSGVTGVLRGVLLASGALSVVAGLVAVLNPVYAAVALTWVLGVWLVVRGLLEAYAAVTTSAGSLRWLRLAAAALLVVAGALFVARPGAAALGIAVWLGLLSLLAGVSLVAAGLLVRGARSAPGAPAPVG